MACEWSRAALWSAGCTHSRRRFWLLRFWLCRSSMRFSAALKAIFPPVHVLIFTVLAAWALLGSSADAPAMAKIASATPASSMVAYLIEGAPLLYRLYRL